MVNEAGPEGASGLRGAVNPGWLGTGIAAILAVFLVIPQLPTPDGDAYRVVAYLCMGLAMAAAATVMVGMGPLATKWWAHGIIVGAVGLGVGLISTDQGWAWSADAGRLVFAGAWGLTAARALQEAAWVPVVALAVTISDAWSVFASSGVTNRVIKSHEEAIPWFTVRVPLPGQPLANAAQLGTTDLLFAGLFIGAALRFGLPVWRTIVALAIALPVTFALGVEVLGGRAVPALPAIAFACVLAYPKFYALALRDAVAGRDSGGTGGTGG